MEDKNHEIEAFVEIIDVDYEAFKYRFAIPAGDASQESYKMKNIEFPVIKNSFVNIYNDFIILKMLRKDGFQLILSFHERLLPVELVSIYYPSWPDQWFDYEICQARVNEIYAFIKLQQIDEDYYAYQKKKDKGSDEWKKLFTKHPDKVG